MEERVAGVEGGIWRNKWLEWRVAYGGASDWGGEWHIWRSKWLGWRVAYGGARDCRHAIVEATERLAAHLRVLVMERALPRQQHVCDHSDRPHID